MATGDISYLYDDADRLIAVIDAAGESAFYTYDAVGNLLTIRRQPSSGLAFVAMRPAAATPGSEVSLLGAGFARSPADNRVTFDGVPATVTSASPTELSVIVPPGAASGPVVVTRGESSVTSPRPFSVESPASPPTIESFDPLVATPGDIVNIRGQGLDDVVPPQWRVNRVHARANGGAATHAELIVPPSGSGRISVWTTRGDASTTDDLFIPPPPFIPADVDATGRVAPGTGLPISIRTPNKIALVTFDGVRGRRVSARLRGDHVPFSTVAIHDLTLALLWSSFIGSEHDLIGPVRLPATGTFTLLIDPYDVHTGDVTVELHDVPDDLSGAIVPDGPSISVRLAAPGQRARFTFEGLTGQRFGLGATDILLGGTRVVTVSVLRPDGTTLVQTMTSRRATDADTGLLPLAGTYTIVVEPERGVATDLSLTLSSPVHAELTVGASPLPLEIPRRGQFAEAHLDGSVGDRLRIVLTDVHLAGDGGTPAFRLEVFSPSNVQIKSAIATGSDEVILGPLPEAGRYAILIDPIDAHTLALSIAIEVI